MLFLQLKDKHKTNRNLTLPNLTKPNETLRTLSNFKLFKRKLFKLYQKPNLLSKRLLNAI